MSSRVRLFQLVVAVLALCAFVADDERNPRRESIRRRLHGCDLHAGHGHLTTSEVWLLRQSGLGHGEVLSEPGLGAQSSHAGIFISSWAHPRRDLRAPAPLG